MLKYMKHDKHGFMPVYNDSDFERNKKYGWTECNMANEVTKVQIEEVADSPEEAYKKKFGKSPHHKMSLDTIIKKLEE